LNGGIERQLDVIVVTRGHRKRDIGLRIRQGYIPTCLSIRTGGAYEAVDFSEADLVLIGASDHPPSEGDVNCIIFGTLLRGRMIQGTDGCYWYAYVDQYLVTKNVEVLAVMTRHFNGLYSSIAYNDPKSTDMLYRPRVEATGYGIKLTISEADLLPISKITSAHHIHFTPSEIAKAVPSDRKKRIEYALQLPEGATLPMASGMIAWACAISEEAFQGVKTMGLFNCPDIAAYTKVAKSLSVEAIIAEFS